MHFFVVFYHSIAFSTNYSFQTLQINGYNTEIMRINDNGDIVGHVYINDNWQSFGIIGSNYQLISGGDARGINNKNNIVGFYTYQSITYGFLKTGTTFDTISIPSARDTQPFNINDNGVVVGTYNQNYEYNYAQHGFIINGSNITSIDVPFGTDTHISDINNYGQYVGYYYTDTGQFGGFLFDGISYIKIDYPGSKSTRVEGINDLGQIVGSFYSESGYEKGFLKDGENYILIDYPGTAHILLFDINNNGTIVGKCEFLNSGGIGGLIGTPDGGGGVIPLPPTVFLLGSGLLGLAGWRRLKKG